MTLGSLCMDCAQTVPSYKTIHRMTKDGRFTETSRYAPKEIEREMGMETEVSHSGSEEKSVESSWHGSTEEDTSSDDDESISAEAEGEEEEARGCFERIKRLVPERVRTTYSSIKGAVRKVVDALSVMKKAWPVIKAVCIYLVLWMAYRVLKDSLKDFYQMMRTMVLAAKALVVGNPAAQVLVDAGEAIGLGEDDKTIEPQSGAALAMVAGSLAVLSPVKEPLSFRFAKAVAMLGPLSVGVGVAKNGFTWLLDKFPDIFREYAYMMMGIDGEKAFSSEVRLAVKRASSALLLWRQPDREYYDFGLAQEVVESYNDLSKLRTSEYAFQRNEHVARPIDGLLRELEAPLVVAMDMLGPSNDRVVPVCLYLQGPSHIGKSTVAVQLSEDLFPAVDPARVSYTKNVATRFWPKYRNQPVVIVDDYATLAGPATGEFNASLLPLLSNLNVGLEMAEAPQKGAPFLSKVVVLTTNLDPSVQPVGVNNPEALRNRFSVAKARILPQFADNLGRLDKGRLSEYLEAHPQEAKKVPHLVFDICSYTRTGEVQIDRRGIPYTELLHWLSGKVEENHQTFCKLRANRAPQSEPQAGSAGITWADVTRAVGRAQDEPEEITAQDVAQEVVNKLLELAPPEVRSQIAEAGLSDREACMAIWDLLLRHPSIKFHEVILNPRFASAVRQRNRRGMVLIGSDYAQVAKEYGVDVDAVPYTETSLGQLLDGLGLRRDLTPRSHGPLAELFLRTVSKATIKPVLDRDTVNMLLMGMGFARLKREQAKASYLAMAQNSTDNRESLAVQCLKWSRGVAAEALTSFMALSPVLAAILVALTTASAIFCLLKRVLNLFRPTTTAQSGDRKARFARDQALKYARAIEQQDLDDAEYRPGETKAQYKARRFAEINPRVEHDLYGGIYPESASTQTSDVLDRLQKCNMIDLTRRGSTLHALVVRGCLAIIPRHFFMVAAEDGSTSLVPQGERFLLEKGTLRLEMAFDLERLRTLSSRSQKLDLVVYNFEGLIDPCRDAVRLFCPRASFPEVNGKTCVLANGKWRDESAVVSSNEMLSYSAIGAKDADLRVVDHWEYKGLNRGDCGTIVYSEAKQGIVGMHVASRSGFTKRGIAIAISREDVECMLEGIEGDLQAQCDPVGDLDVYISDQHIKCATLEYIADLTNLPVQREAKNKARLLPYSEEPWGEAKSYLPSVLGVSSPHNPKPAREVLDYAMLSFCKDVKHFNPTELRLCLHHAMDTFHSLTPERTPVGLSVEEAINGGLEKLNSLPMDTGAGLMYSGTKDSPPRKGKKHLFSEYHPRVITDPGLARDLYEALEALDRGEEPVLYWQAQLKPEMRPSSRVMGTETGGMPKTRMIIASSTCATLLYRMYFGEFISHVYRGFTRFETAVGMNVLSGDWDQMVSRLKAVSSVGFDGDYSGMESYFTRQVAYELGFEINRWYKVNNPDIPDEFLRAQRILIHTMIFANVCVGNQLYRDHDHNKSGNVLTTLINCIVVMTHFRLAWRELAAVHQPDVQSLGHFSRNVALKVFGDDNISAVSKSVPWFNCQSVGDVLAQYSIVFTSADKTASAAVLKPLEQLSFLKMSTVVDASRRYGSKYMPYVEEASVIKSMMWTQSTLSDLEMVVILGNESLCRLWPSGVTRFNLWRDRISRVWSRLGITNRPYTWAEIEERWLDGTLWDIFFCPNSGCATIIPEVRIEPQGGEEPQDIQEAKIGTAVEGDVGGKMTLFGGDVVRNVVEPMKRTTMVFIAPGADFYFSVADLLGLDNEYFMNPMRWFGQIYRTYVGEFMVVGVPASATSHFMTMSCSSLGQYQKIDITTASCARGSPIVVAGQFLEGVVPNPQVYACNVVPTFPGERMLRSSNYSTVSMCSPGTTLSVLAGACDGFRLANVIQVPRLRISGNEFPHLGGGGVDVPEFINIAPGGFGVPYIKQALANTLVPVSITPATGIAPLLELELKTSDLDDYTMASLGIIIPPGAGRNVLIGTTDYFIGDLSGFYSVPAVMACTLGGSSTSFPTLKSTSYTLGGTVTTITNSEGLTETVADTLSFGFENVNNPQFKNGVGIPLGAVCLRNPGTANVTPPKGPLKTDHGQSRRAILVNPLVSLRTLIEPEGGEQTEGEGVVLGQPVNAARNIDIGAPAPSSLENQKVPQYMASINWTPSSGEGAILAAYNLPLDGLVSKKIKAAWAGNLLWRGNPVVTVSLQSTQFVGGAVMVVWAPLMSPIQAAALYGGNLASSFAAGGHLMFPSADNTVEIPIPYVHPKVALDTRKLASEGLGTLLLQVVSPLNLGPDSPITSLTLTTSISFEDSVFTIVNPKNGPIEAQGGVQTKMTTYNLSRVEAKSIDFKDDSKTEFTGGATDLEAPLDKPNVACNPLPVVNRSAPNFVNSVQLTYAPRLGLQAQPTASVDASRFGVLRDEMSLAYLAGIMTPVGAFSMATGDAVNSILFTGDLCPGSELFTLGLGALFTPSMLTYVSLPFSYWRGSIKVRLVVFASQIHTAKLAVCSHIGFEAQGLSINEAMGQYTTIVDVKGPTVVDIIFPWQASQSWLRVCNGSYADASGFSMGQFSIRVLAPLQYMASVASTIRGMVLIGAGSDYQLSTYENGAVDFSIEPIDA